jgi:hypothetical protein
MGRLAFDVSIAKNSPSWSGTMVDDTETDVVAMIIYLGG